MSRMFAWYWPVSDDSDFSKWSFCLGAFITLILILPICTGVFYATLKTLRSQATKAVGKERDQIRGEIEKYDHAIARAVEHLRGMASLDDLTSRD